MSRKKDWDEFTQILVEFVDYLIHFTGFLKIVPLSKLLVGE